MKLFNKTLFLIILTLVVISSCSTVGSGTSPSVGITNYSQQLLYKIKVNWNGYYLNNKFEVSPGGGGTENFWLRKKSDFFGPITVTWQNAKGKIISKQFILTKKEFPDAYNRRKRSIIDLYLTQDDLYYVTSDHPNFKQINSERGNQATKWFQEYGMKKCYEKNGENSRKCNDREGFLRDKCERDFGSNAAKQCINLDRCYKKLGENTPKCNDAMEMRVVY